MSDNNPSINKGTNQVRVTIEQLEDGRVIYGPADIMNYPGINNALANNLVLSVLDALAVVGEKYGQAKAERGGQGAAFDALAEFREKLRKDMRNGAGLKTS